MSTLDYLSHYLPYEPYTYIVAANIRELEDDLMSACLWHRVDQVKEICSSPEVSKKIGQWGAQF